MDYTSLPDTTRVWIYQSNRPFSEEEIRVIDPAIQRFTDQWVSHNRDLKAFGKVFHEQFIVLMVDESHAGASGCSIDKSVYFIKQIEQAVGVDLFDRMTFTYQEEGKKYSVPRAEFARLYQEGKINDQTLVFDNLVNNKGDFETAWIKPLGESWHKRMV